MNFTMLYALESRLHGYGTTPQEQFWRNVLKYSPYVFLGIALFVVIVLTIVVNIKPKKKEHQYIYFCDRGELLKVDLDSFNPITLPYPKREGYAFAGWFYDSAYTVPYISKKRLKPNTVLYAKWAKEG